MTALAEKVQLALDETRMLVLGMQVLIGFEYQSAFMPGFEALGRSSQLAKMGCLGLMLAALGFILMPAPLHGIAFRGRDSEALLRLTMRIMELALLPFAVALGWDVALMVNKVSGRTAAIAAGVALTAVALFFWYGLALAAGGRLVGGSHEEVRMQRQEKTDLDAKIRHVLTEARVVLPGAQATLGFQLVTVLAQGFDRLPGHAKAIHIAALFCLALTIVLLVAPAAYHRLAERGEASERFHRRATVFVLASMPPLALGLAGDLFVVLEKVVGSIPFAAGSAVALLLLYHGVWFGYSVAVRRRLDAQAS